jgi:hypothetical protein
MNLIERKDMCSLEEARDLLYFIAGKMKKKHEDIDELVNAVWLMGRVQKAKKEHWGTTIKWCILRYRDQRDGTRDGKVIRSTPKTTSLDSLREDAGDAFGCEDGGFEAIDNKDFYEIAMNSLESPYKEVINVVVVDGKTVKEAAEILDMPRQKVATLRDKALEQLRIRFKDSI